MSTDLSLHHRRRKPSADELAGIPWLPLLQAQERACAEEVLLVGDAPYYERLGFQREGLLRERWIVAGEVSDTALYGLIRSDWHPGG